MKASTKQFAVILFACLLIAVSSSSILPPNTTKSPQCHPGQRSALLQFSNNLALNNSTMFNFYCYEDSGVSSFPKTASWRKGTDCCLWDGVECDESSGNVISLDLSCSRLRGKISSNSTLFQLPHLQRLNLAYNDFQGSLVSSALDRLVKVTHLNISYTWFSGRIPFEISHLSKLVSLDLSYNFDLELDSHTFEMMSKNLTHLKHLFLDFVSMPAVNPTSFLNLSGSLEWLSLSHCKLQGKFPVSVFNLVYLKQLKMSGNEGLIVNLPLSNWSGPLEILDLSATSLSQKLSQSAVNLKSLKSLTLDGCGLEGSVPRFISNLTHITRLSLDGNNLTGEIPAFLSNLKRLTYLSLSGNNLAGEVPDLFGNLTILTHLYLRSSNLQGRLPSSMFGHPQLLTLHLSYNELNFLPSDVSGPSKLIELSIEHNKLKGQVPEWFGNLTKLIVLDLSSNNLEGHLPSSIFSHPQLSRLHLYDNELVSLPSDVSSLSKLTELGLGNNRLNGTIPSWFFNISSLQFLILFDNQHVGSIPEITTGLVNLTYLSLDYNKINGTTPPWLFSLPKLQDLNLRNNRLVGEIPEIMSRSIENIDLGQNMLHGRIPETMFQLTNLASLDLSSNNFFIGIREIEGFQNLTKLRWLSLSHSYVSIPAANTFDLKWPKLDCLYLSSCNISEFPDFLKTQDELQFLDLSNNNIRGDVPKWVLSIGKETLWVLDLSHNHLTGTIQLPWQYLRVVDLKTNMLSGPLPVVPPLMRFCSISNNSLSGNMPSEICDANFLEVLDLSHNKLNGKIPPCLGNLTKSLSVINLQKNNFEGSIEMRFLEECNLRNLNFQGNRLEGSIPNSLMDCAEPQILNLGDNMLNDKFPSWLGTCKELQVLVLRSNKLHGSIPELRTNESFPKMLVLDLSHNNFTGCLLASFMKILTAMMNVIDGESDGTYLGTTNFSTNVRYDYSMTVNFKGYEIEIQKIFHIFTNLDFSNNEFHGEIPYDLGQFHALRGLNLSHNMFSGKIPPSFGSLTSLEWLDLSSNKLVGKIPQQLVQISTLAILNLSNNQLVGHVPEGKQFNTFTVDSYRGNTGLCGNPLPRKCGDEETPGPVSSIDDNNSFLDHGFGWQAVAVGYGCGMISGVGMGYIMFRYRKPQWLLLIIEEKFRFGQHGKCNLRRSRLRRN